MPDADIAKMDPFTNLSTSTAKSTRKRNPAQPKKKQGQTTGNRKPSPKKTKGKPATSSSKTDKVGTPLKPTAFSICESDKVKTPPNKVVNADLKVKSPETPSDQLVTRKTGVINGLSESNKIKVKRKKRHSVSESDHTETPSKKAETEKTHDISEPKPTETPCKKTKSKKDVKVIKPGILVTPSRVTETEVATQTSLCSLDSAELSESNHSKQSEGVLHPKTGETKVKKDKSKKVKIEGTSASVDTSIQTSNEDKTGSLTTDPSKINQVLDFSLAETPSKKAKSKKSKKSKEHEEFEDVTVSSGQCHIKGENGNSDLHQTETLPSFVEPVGKQSKKAKKSLEEPNGTVKPSKKIENQAATSILEPLGSGTPSKKSKTNKVSETNQLGSSSKKAVADVWEGETTKSSSSKSDHNDNLSKKSKRKRTESSGENVAASLSEHVSGTNSGLDNSFIPAESSTDNQGQESVSAVEEEGNPEPKKKKKKKKDKEKKNNESDENVKEVPPPPPPPAEETADSTPSSQKKKS